MDFAFTPEQDDLREVVRDFLTHHAVRSREPGSSDSALWRRFTVELGLAGPDLGAVERAVVLEETGRALLALPYLTTLVAGQFLPADLVAAAAGAPATVHCGEGLAVRGGRIFGTVDGVLDGDVAMLAALAAAGDDGRGLYAVRLDGPGVSRRATSTQDLSRPTATFTFGGAPATRLAATPAVGPGRAAPPARRPRIPLRRVASPPHARRRG